MPKMKPVDWSNSQGSTADLAMGPMGRMQSPKVGAIAQKRIRDVADLGGETMAERSRSGATGASGGQSGRDLCWNRRAPLE
jgi:hypothetical protein